MYYVPKLRSGEIVPLYWSIRVTRWLNHVYWPLEEDATNRMRIIDRAAWFFGFAIFQFHNEAQFRHLWKNLNDIDTVLSGVPTYIVLVEIMFRGFGMSWTKHRYQKLLKRFYAEIYVEEKSEKQLFEGIDRQLLPTKFYSCLYLSALLAIILFPVVRFLFFNGKDTLFAMSFQYDYTPNYIYIPLTLASTYVGTIVTTVIIGEGYMTAACIFHLNARFLKLRNNLHSCVELMLKSCPADSIGINFRREMIKIIQENVKLLAFATDVQKEFTVRFFISFFFNGSLLCALSFKAYTNPTESIGFDVWMMAKLLEMLSLGHVGSTIRYTTDDVSKMYYECGWEQIIERSANRVENVHAMKLILTAMELNHKPVILSGLGFFTLSLDAVVLMLKAAFSLFSCLIAVR